MRPRPPAFPPGWLLLLVRVAWPPLAPLGLMRMLLLLLLLAVRLRYSRARIERYVIVRQSLLLVPLLGPGGCGLGYVGRVVRVGHDHVRLRVVVRCVSGTRCTGFRRIPCGSVVLLGNVEGSKRCLQCHTTIVVG